MFTLHNIVELAITATQIFLTFTLITMLLKIKVSWWVTLAFSAVITPLSSDNALVMLAVFIGSAFPFYFIASEKQLKLTALAMVLHLFSSLLVASVVQFGVVFLIPFFEVNFHLVRIFSIFMYIALLCFIKYKKFDMSNLIHNKMVFTLSILMLLINFAIYTYTPYIHTSSGRKVF